MDCTIIFYSARKTSLCERALKDSLSTSTLAVRDAFFSNGSDGLAEGIKKAFGNSPVVFVIGGTRLYDERQVTSVISNVIEAQSIDECKRLKNNFGDDGYVLKSGEQTMILLPDEPDGIKDIMKEYVIQYIIKQEW